MTMVCDNGDVGGKQPRLGLLHHMGKSDFVELVASGSSWSEGNESIIVEESYKKKIISPLNIK